MWSCVAGIYLDDPLYLKQGCPLIEAGAGYIDEEPYLIGKASCVYLVPDTNTLHGIPDTNMVNIGCHYFDWNYAYGTLKSDLYRDKVVNFVDFAFLAAGWLTIYDMNDLVSMADEWMEMSDISLLGVTLNQDANSVSNVLTVMLDSASDGENSLDSTYYLLMDGQYFGRFCGGDIAMPTYEYCNGQHELKVVGVNPDGEVIAGSVININVNNRLYCLSGSETYEYNQAYRFGGFYEPNYGSMIDLTIKDLDANVVWTNSSSGNFNFEVPAGVLQSSYNELTIQESAGAMRSYGGIETAESGDEDWTIDITKKFNITSDPNDANAKSLLVSPVEKFTAGRKGAWEEFLRTCKKRGRSPTICLFGGQATPPEGNDFNAIAAGNSHSLALKSDGSIVGWGRNDYGEATPPSGNDFIAIAAGFDFSLALKSDGSIMSWGYDYGEPPSGNDFIAISAGWWHCLALKSDGSVVGWGGDINGETASPDGNDFVAIAAGGGFSLALKSDGSIINWGFNPSDLITPPEGNDFVAISAGWLHCLALKSDGSIVGWGYNNYGQANSQTAEDPWANIVERYSYDVFGKTTIKDANGIPRTASAFGNRFMFTGRELDSETGLYYYRARFYNPRIGRFLQADPIGYEGGLNLYTYCGNNPLNFIDSYGLFGFAIGFGISGGAGFGYTGGAQFAFDFSGNCGLFLHGGGGAYYGGSGGATFDVTGFSGKVSGLRGLFNSTGGSGGELGKLGGDFHSGGWGGEMGGTAHIGGAGTPAEAHSFLEAGAVLTPKDIADILKGAWDFWNWLEGKFEKPEEAKPKEAKEGCEI